MWHLVLFLCGLATGIPIGVFTVAMCQAAKYEPDEGGRVR